MLVGQPERTRVAVLEVGLGLVLVLLDAAAERYLGEEAGEFPTTR